MNEEKKKTKTKTTTQEATRSDQGFVGQKRHEQRLCFGPMSVVGGVLVNFSQRLGSSFVIFLMIISPGDRRG